MLYKKNKTLLLYNYINIFYNAITNYKFLLFILKKIIYRINFVKKLVIKFKLLYPLKLKKELKVISILKKNNFTFHNFTDQLNISKNTNSDQKIELAGIRIDLNKNLNLDNLNFKDNEDIESFHRFLWLIKDLSKNNFKIYNSNYEKIINDWHIYFEIKKKDIRNLEFSSYTIAERLSNLCMYYHLINKRPSKEISYKIISQLKILIENLEFSFPKSNNHLFNNFKSIYIVSCFFKIYDLKKLASDYLINSFNYFVDKDDLLAEGSSHYTLIFYRWCVEIHYLSYLSEDQITHEFFKKKIFQMRNNIDKFLINNICNENNFIKFGDISPDANVNFLYNYCNFLNTKITYKNNIDFKDNVDFLYNLDNWIMVKYKNYNLFIRKVNFKSFEYHEHDDFFHFVLAYLGKQIFIDPGNKNYDDDNVRSFYKSSNSHNSISINNNNFKNQFSNFDKKNKKTHYISSFIDDKILIKSSVIVKKNFNEINRNFIFENDNKFKITNKIQLDKIGKLVRLNFHLHPEYSIFQLNINEYKIQNLNSKFILQIMTKKPFTFNTQTLKSSFLYNGSVDYSYFYLDFKNINELEIEIVLRLI